MVLQAREVDVLISRGFGVRIEKLCPCEVEGEKRTYHCSETIQVKEFLTNLRMGSIQRTSRKEFTVGRGVSPSTNSDSGSTAMDILHPSGEFIDGIPPPLSCASRCATRTAFCISCQDHSCRQEDLANALLEIWLWCVLFVVIIVCFS